VGRLDVRRSLTTEYILAEGAASVRAAVPSADSSDVPSCSRRNKNARRTLHEQGGIRRKRQTAAVNTTDPLSTAVPLS
jgi:hypothetical protein